MENKKQKLESRDSVETEHNPDSADTDLESTERDDSTTLLNIFPEEIWQMILEKYLKSTDLENISNASSFFRTLLLPERVTFLFENVAKILASQYFKKHQTDDAYNETSLQAVRENNGNVLKTNCTVCSRRVGWQWFSSILKMRLGCKSWCTSVNNILHSREENSQKKKWNNFSFDERVEEHFGKQNGYPFNPAISLFTRNALFSRWGICIDDYGEHYINMVRGFGQYFQHCELNEASPYPSSAQGYLKFKELLELLPNLKSLNAHFLNNYFETVPRPQLVENVSELQTTINSYPLIQLDKLEKVSGYFDSTVLYELVRVAKNINNLTLSYSPKTKGRLDFDKLNLPKLETFSLRSAFSENVLDLEKTQTTWFLKSLELSFHTRTFVIWDEVFKLVKNKWGNTLATLILDFTKVKDDERKNQIISWSKNLKLELPNLKNLKLAIRNLYALDFILPVKDSLESLKLTVWFSFDAERENNPEMFDELEKNQIIQFVGYTAKNKMMDSNIWQIFPCLKQITNFEYCTGGSVEWVITRDQII